MNVVAGALAPDAGTMTLDGAAYAPASPLDARRRGIALIHQELSLCEHLTVAENILMGLEPARAGWLDGGGRAGDGARDGGGARSVPASGPARRPPRVDLPIAARQVVEICRAMAARASIVLMDEPTSSLPREDVQQLFALIRRLRERGVAIVYISHFLEEVREIADAFTVLRDGRSVASGRLRGRDQRRADLRTWSAVRWTRFFPSARRRRRRAAARGARPGRAAGAPPGVADAATRRRCSASPG